MSLKYERSSEPQIGILELPFCCTSLTICKEIQPYMAIFEVIPSKGVPHL